MQNYRANWAGIAQFSKDETGCFVLRRVNNFEERRKFGEPNFWGEFFGSFFARQKMNVKNTIVMIE